METEKIIALILMGICVIFMFFLLVFCIKDIRKTNKEYVEIQEETSIFKERMRELQEKIDKNDKLIEATQEEIKANDKLINAYDDEDNIIKVDFSRGNK